MKLLMRLIARLFFSLRYYLAPKRLRVADRMIQKQADLERTKLCPICDHISHSDWCQFEAWKKLWEAR